MVIVLLVLALITAVGASGWTSANQRVRTEPANHRLRSSRDGWAVFTLCLAASLVFALVYLFF